MKVAADEKQTAEKNLNGLRPGANLLGRTHHPALGIRIPEMFLPGVLASLDKHNCAAGFMLSFGRETAPESIIQAPPGRYEITLGHTGTSIRKYLIHGSRAARNAGVPVEMEADHLIITESSAMAVKRIEGVKTPRLVGPAALEKSIRYNQKALDEAIYTGVVRAFTTDTSDLFDEEIEKKKGSPLTKAFKNAFSKEEQDRLLKTYVGRFRFKAADGKPVRIELTKERLMMTALKFKKSIEINARIYEDIRKRMKHPFSFEVSMDETENPTPAAQLYFYLAEWKHLGHDCDFVAPNIGFKKREDYTDNLTTLRNRVRSLHAIAQNFGALLSFHSGSGSSPYSGKGQDVYPVLLECTGKRLKYKISGIYFELLMEILAGHKKGTDARILYELIHKEVMDFLRGQIENQGQLDSRILRKQVSVYDSAKQMFDPRADAFRYHSFLALNFRDQKGRRYFRDRLIRLYNEDFKLKKQIDQEMEALTSRLIEGLQFQNNF
ncbi:MAG: tagaturonate epimerase family protein [bacterium]